MTVTCPCCSRQVSADPAQLNAHIDACLTGGSGSPDVGEDSVTHASSSGSGAGPASPATPATPMHACLASAATNAMAGAATVSDVAMVESEQDTTQAAEGESASELVPMDEMNEIDEQLVQFMALLPEPTSRTAASRILRRAGGNVQRAVALFFDQATVASPSKSSTSPGKRKQPTLSSFFLKRDDSEKVTSLSMPPAMTRTVRNLRHYL